MVAVAGNVYNDETNIPYDVADLDGVEDAGEVGADGRLPLLQLMLMEKINVDRPEWCSRRRRGWC